MKRMSRLLAVLVTAAAFVGLADVAQAQKSSVAVLEIRPTDAVRAKLARLGGRKEESLEILLDSMRTGLEVTLADTNKFRVIAHKDLEQLMEKVSMEQMTADPSDPALAAEFSNAAVEYVVVVDLELFKDEFATLNVGGSAAEKRNINVAGTSKIYHIETGELVSGKKYRSEAKSQGKQVNPNIRSDAGPRGDEMLIEFADEVGASLAYRVMDVAYPIRVLRSARGQVMLNRGDDGSIAKGDILDVFIRDGDPIEDPDTGEVLYFEIPLGQVEVTRVTPKASFAKVIDGDPDEFNDDGVICRKIEDDG